MKEDLKKGTRTATRLMFDKTPLMFDDLRQA